MANRQLHVRWELLSGLKLHDKCITITLTTHSPKGSRCRSCLTLDAWRAGAACPRYSLQYRVVVFGVRRRGQQPSARASSSNCQWVAGWCQFDIWWAHRVAQRRRSTRESVQQTRALINERRCGGFRCQSSGQLRRASCRRPLNRYPSAGRLEIGTGSIENMRFGARGWNCVEQQTPRESRTRFQCCM
jgi:hypothetical protein